MNHQKKLAARRAKTLANPPGTINLPGGVQVKSFPFRITSTDREGRPLTFERARGNESQDCVLWGAPDFLDEKLPAHLDQRFRDRIEASIEGPESIMDSGKVVTCGCGQPATGEDGTGAFACGDHGGPMRKTYVKERSVGISEYVTDERDIVMVSDQSSGHAMRAMLAEGAKPPVVIVGHDPGFKDSTVMVGHGFDQDGKPRTFPVTVTTNTKGGVNE